MAMAQFQQLLESQKMVAKLGAQRCMGALGALAMVFWVWGYNLVGRG